MIDLLQIMVPTKPVSAPNAVAAGAPPSFLDALLQVAATAAPSEQSVGAESSPILVPQKTHVDVGESTETENALVVTMAPLEPVGFHTIAPASPVPNPVASTGLALDSSNSPVRVAPPEVEELSALMPVLPHVSALEVIEIVNTNAEVVTLTAPWKLMASWLTTSTINLEVPLSPAMGMPSRPVSSASQHPATMPVEQTTSQGMDPSGMDSRVRHELLAREADSPFESVVKKVSEREAAATGSILASEAWRSRLLHLIGTLPHQAPRLRVRDFRLSEADVGRLASELRTFFESNGQQLASIWVNGRSVWSRAGS